VNATRLAQLHLAGGGAVVTSAKKKKQNWMNVELWPNRSSDRGGYGKQ